MYAGVEQEQAESESVSSCLCVFVLSECVCVCVCVRVYTFKPRIKARAGGLLPAFFSATRCLSLLSEGEIRAGGGEGTKGRGKRGRGG